jgi:hypothetical protein
MYYIRIVQNLRLKHAITLYEEVYMKRIAMIFLSVILIAGPAGAVPAEDLTYGDPVIGQVSEKPFPIEDLSGDEGDPLGTLTSEELDILNEKLDREDMINRMRGMACKDTVPRLHFSIIIHTHVVDTIYNTFDGALDRGEVASGYNPGPGTTTLSFSQTLGYSNGWNASIGFSHQAVTASVGYNVTYSSSASFTYSMQVAEGHTGHIGHQDWYHVQEFTCFTVYYQYPNNVIGYGDGWAQQWYKKHFYCWITPGNTP